jgi:hypothetical protein
MGPALADVDGRVTLNKMVFLRACGFPARMTFQPRAGGAFFMPSRPSSAAASQHPSPLRSTRKIAAAALGELAVGCQAGAGAGADCAGADFANQAIEGFVHCVQLCQVAVSVICQKVERAVAR